MINDHRLGLPLEPVVPPSSFSGLLREWGLDPKWEVPPGEVASVELTEGTTILAIRYADGVVMAGDRQATEGSAVAHRRVQKVYPADGYSAVAISGVAGIAVEMVKLFQTELEHYEKLEGTRLSLTGKANYLGSLVRGQFPMAMQGLVVVPLFCGYDEAEGGGHLFTFDVVGGRYEETDYAATGSGGREAKSHLRNNYAEGADEAGTVRLAVEALVAAAEEDTATAGPDLRRGIYPTVVSVSEGGYQEIGEDRIAEVSSAVLEARS